MPSTYTASGRFTLQATGENLNTWGAILNSGVFQLVDTNINGCLSFALSGTKTLTTANGSTDEARYAILYVTSGSGGTVVIPAVSKEYTVVNSAGGAVVVSCAGGGATATCQSGETAKFTCDATNVRKIIGTDFGGSRITSVATPFNTTDAANKAYVDNTAWAYNAGALPAQAGSANKFLQTDGTSPTWTYPTVAQVTGAAPLAAPSFTGGVTMAGGLAVSSGGTTYTGSVKANVQALAAVDFDLSAADFFTKSISGATTFTFSNATAAKAQAFIVELTISSAAVPSWPASVKWGGGVDPSSALGNGRHVIGFVTFNGGTTWTGMLGAVAAA